MDRAVQVDFKNTIIVLTSNLGSDVLAHQKEGEPTAMVQGEVMSIVRQHFRPEFLKSAGRNRVVPASAA